MRPVVVAAVLLLVVLMSMSASAASPYARNMCRAKHPVNYCRKNVGRGFFQYGPDRCVKAFHDRHFSFDAAKKACRWFKGGDLVSIHSYTELEQVICAMHRATSRKLNYWIGHFRGKNGFYWTDGSKRDYAYWYRGQPDNYFFKEHCVEMNYRGWGKWNDAKCSSIRPTVCQVKI